MEGISEQAEVSQRNSDLINEFEIYFKDNPSLSELRNDIRGMLYRTIIPTYEKTFTEEDVIGELKCLIYENKKEWNRGRYPRIKQYLVSNAWNIIKGEADLLKSRYGIQKSKRKRKGKKHMKEQVCEDVQFNSEKSGENFFHDGITLYSAKPKNRFYTLDHYKENEIDEEEKYNSRKEESKLFDMRSFTEQNDMSKFEEAVMIILEKEKDSKLVAVFNGHMDKKRPCAVMKECNMSASEYNNARKRLYYTLKRDLSIQFRNIVSASVIVHVMMWYLRRVNLYCS